MIVGVNEFVTDEPELSIPILKVGARRRSVAARASMAKMRAERDNARVQRRRSTGSATAAKGTENVFPYILECARRYCTLYEIRAALEDVFGAYREPVFF